MDRFAVQRVLLESSFQFQRHGTKTLFHFTMDKVGVLVAGTAGMDPIEARLVGFPV